MHIEYTDNANVNCGEVKSDFDANNLQSIWKKKKNIALLSLFVNFMSFCFLSCTPYRRIMYFMKKLFYDLCERKLLRHLFTEVKLISPYRYVIQIERQ